MNTFKNFLASTVAEAKYQLKAEERLEQVQTTHQYHKVIDQMVDTYNQKVDNFSDGFKKDVTQTLDRVLHDENYSQARKRSRLENRWNAEDDYWNYLLSTAPQTASKPKVNIKIKQKKLPKGSYIPAKPSKSTTTYDRYNVYKKVNGKDVKINTQSLTNYLVSDIREYKKALVLDLLPVETRASKRYYDDVVLQKESNEVDRTRDKEELNALHTYYVFRDEQLTGDGIQQLKQFLHSQKFVEEQLPSTPITVREASKFLIGHVIGLPRAEFFNFSASTDNNYVFITNDIDTFDDIYREDTGCGYQLISEYIERDKDKEGHIIPDTYESLPSEVYAKPSTAIGNIIKYECHKEFATRLPLELAHVSNIFD